MSKIRCYLQIEENECAACCIAMIMSKYNRNFNLEEIKENIGVSRDGVSMLAIKEYLVEKNFDVKTYTTNVRGLFELNAKALILWENHHYVILNRKMCIRDRNCIFLVL